jgi:hypothetical protein
MSTKAIIAAVVGAIAYFLLGWLVYGLLLMDYYTAHTIHYEGLMKSDMNLPILFLDNLSWAFLLSFIFDRWAGIRTFKGGLFGGLIIAFFAGLSMNLYYLSAMNLFTTGLLFADLLANMFVNAIVGGVIGFMLGIGQKGD